MIVVEGPDGAGKTTLINYLVQETGLPVAPRVVSKDAQAQTDLKKWVEDTNDKGWQPIIFDRHRLISEPIYGPILRREPEPGFDNLDWFMQQLHYFYGLEPTVIFCLPPWPVVWNNIMTEDDNKIFHGSPQKAFQIWSGYFNLATTLSVTDPLANFWLYDYSDPTYEVLKNYLPVMINRKVKEHS